MQSPYAGNPSLLASGGSQPNADHTVHTPILNSQPHPHTHQLQNQPYQQQQQIQQHPQPPQHPQHQYRSSPLKRPPPLSVPSRRNGSQPIYSSQDPATSTSSFSPVSSTYSPSSFATVPSASPSHASHGYTASPATMVPNPHTTMPTPEASQPAGSAQPASISMPRSRPLPSPSSPYSTQQAQRSQQILKMPVPEIPPDDTSYETSPPRSNGAAGPSTNYQYTPLGQRSASTPSPTSSSPSSAVKLSHFLPSPRRLTSHSEQPSQKLPYPVDKSPQLVIPSQAAAIGQVPAATTTTTAPQINGTSKHHRFGSEASVTASDLTVEQFEMARRHAATQPHDPRTQLDLAKRLCEASDHLASHYTDPNTPSTLEVDPQQEARNREAWTSQAVKIAKKLASRSHYPEALFFVGSLYSIGKYGVEADYIKALEYYQKAAKLEHPEACYRVAVCHEFGVGTRRSIEKAVVWYKKAAMLGSVGSMYKLGMLSLLGSLDQPRDFNTGVQWLQRAADKADSKNPHAVHELALLYERSQLSTYSPGDVFPHSEAKALEHYYASAKLGYAPSQARLGRAFEFGELGCSVDPAWSISWYSQAAQQGDSDAELGMAGWYWTGSPQLKKNDTEAFLWAERAASKGNARAMYAVGYFCEVGIGVHRDLARAKQWYTLAADKKHPRAMKKLREID